MVIKLREKKAVVLISTLIVLSFLAIIGMTLVALVFSRLVQVEMEAYRLKAFYYAESGIAAALNRLKSDVDADKASDNNIRRTEFKEGWYEAFVDPSAGTITGIGECHGARREIEIKYKTL